MGDSVRFASPWMAVKSFTFATNPVFETIRSFELLASGWHYGSGAPLPGNIVALAEELASEAEQSGLTKMDAFPTKDGAITVAIYMGKDDHSFQVQPDGSVRYWQETSADFEEELFEFSQAIERIQLLSKIHQISWNSFITFTSGIGIEPRDISEVRLSNPQVTVVESPLWVTSAFSGAVAAFVLTLASSTQTSLQSRLFSGDLIPHVCLKAAP